MERCILIRIYAIALSFRKKLAWKAERRERWKWRSWTQSDEALKAVTWNEIMKWKKLATYGCEVSTLSFGHLFGGLRVPMASVHAPCATFGNVLVASGDREMVFCGSLQRQGPWSPAICWRAAPRRTTFMLRFALCCSQARRLSLCQSLQLLDHCVNQLFLSLSPSRWYGGE